MLLDVHPKWEIDDIIMSSTRHLSFDSVSIPGGMTSKHLNIKSFPVRFYFRLSMPSDYRSLQIWNRNLSVPVLRLGTSKYCNIFSFCKYSFSSNRVFSRSIQNGRGTENKQLKVNKEIIYLLNGAEELSRYSFDTLLSARVHQIVNK